MKKRINLLTKLEKYKKLEKIFFWVKVVSLLSIVFVLLINLFFTFLFLNKKKEIEELNTKKLILLQFISQNAPVEAKYQIFSERYSLLKKNLNDDANFFPYYQLITQSLQSATSGAVLKSIEIAKDKKTNFAVGFSSFEEMRNFLQRAESEEFTKNFQELILKNFSFGQEYQLNFEGRFKENL